jgi:hypothetical protein
MGIKFFVRMNGRKRNGTWPQFLAAQERLKQMRQMLFAFASKGGRIETIQTRLQQDWQWTLVHEPEEKFSVFHATIATVRDNHISSHGVMPYPEPSRGVSCQWICCSVAFPGAAPCCFPRPAGLHPMAAALRREYFGVMTTKSFFAAGCLTGLMAGTAVLGALTGCTSTGTYPHSGYRQGPETQTQTVAVIQGDYDYFPGYETYYDRNRHEYIYRDGNAWVRKSQPRGVTADVLQAAPSARMDFHDSPENHHSAVVKAYPKTWKQPAKVDDGKGSREEDKKG